MIHFGHSQTFALRILPLAGGPEDGDSAAAATWIALELWVDGRNLTAHTHELDQTVHTALHWPAIHLARWFVRSWNGLYQTARWPIAPVHHACTPREVLRAWDASIAEDDPTDEVLDARDSFVATHFMEAASAGGLVPSVCFSRESDSVIVSWSNLGARRDGVLFHRAEGRSAIDARGFASAVRGFVDWVADRLEPDSPDRRELGDWLESFELPTTAREMLWSFSGVDSRKRAALLRRIPDLNELFALDPGWDEAGALSRPELSPIAVAFRSVSPSIDAKELLALRAAILGLGSRGSALGMLELLSAAVGSPSRLLADHDQGYQLAESVRSALGNPTDYLDVEGLLVKLGVPTVEVSLSDGQLDGGAVCDETHGPAVFLNPHSPRVSVSWGRRMVLAHELCHLLFDRHRAIPLAVVSGPWAPPGLERRANAFAAELLLPKRGLARLATKWTGDDLVEQATSTFGVGYQTASWQVENRLL